MTKIDIKNIITKYLKQEATAEEISILYEWVNKEGNHEVFKKLVQADFLMNYHSESWDSQEAFEKFLKNIRDKEESKSKPFYMNPVAWKYAASLLILVASTAYFMFNRNIEQASPQLFDPEEITLKLDNGEIINITQHNDTILKVKNGVASIHLNKGVLHHNNNANSIVKSGYNILTIPKGKIISITLEDGSVVKLNSGSELRYPSSFAGLNKRQVYLKGEAFFDITKNPKKPFVVKTDKMFTQVYGTVFNVSAYEDDDEIEVVLVEGSVGVGGEHDFSAETLKMIKPSQKVTNSKALENSYHIEDVDVIPYISWTKGIVAFQNERMSGIIKKLERQFNVEIINENDRLGELRFTGMFDKEGIDLILKTIQTHTNFTYSKEGKIITIKKQ